MKTSIAEIFKEKGIENIGNFNINHEEAPDIRSIQPDKDSDIINMVLENMKLLNMERRDTLETKDLLEIQPRLVQHLNSGELISQLDSFGEVGKRVSSITVYFLGSFATKGYISIPEIKENKTELKGLMDTAKPHLSQRGFSGYISRNGIFSDLDRLIVSGLLVKWTKKGENRKHMSCFSLNPEILNPGFRLKKPLISTQVRRKKKKPLEGFRFVKESISPSETTSTPHQEIPTKSTAPTPHAQKVVMDVELELNVWASVKINGIQIFSGKLNPG